MALSGGTHGLFALVLGLLAWIYLGAITTVICAEFNAVRAGQLWPRALLTPFTNNVGTHARGPACLHLLRQDRTS
jgi:uncharacterized BrkB/YihY/UPF0761 family membrane protein